MSHLCNEHISDLNNTPRFVLSVLAELAESPMCLITSSAHGSQSVHDFVIFEHLINVSTKKIFLFFLLLRTLQIMPLYT